jgi:hypothetical protein
MAKPRHRRVWLLGGVVVAWGVVLLPLLLLAPAREPVGLALAQALICGVVLGAGRQGIDMLILRLLAASMALLLGTYLSELKQHHAQLCTGPQDCAQWVVFGGLGFGMFGTIILALVALPLTVLWNRGTASLKPEVNWPVPKTRWQWLLFGLALVLVLPFLGVLIGIPWPA